MLRTEVPLEQFKPLFPDWRAVLAFHAKRLSNIHSGPTRSGNSKCEGCGEEASLEVVELRWIAFYHTGWTVLGTVVGAVMALGVGGVMPSKVMQFSTRHLLCLGCFKRAYKGGFTDVFLRHLYFALILIGLIAGSMGLLFGSLFLFNKPSAKEVLGAFGGLLLGTGCIALVLFLLRKSRTLHLRRVPKHLKYIGKPPFVLDSACPLRLSTQKN